jgi:hypothetical protein
MTHAFFATAAEREVAAREKHYPAQITAGEIARDDAEADLAAWRVIAAMFADGSAESEQGWAPLELATSRALQRREAELAASPDNDRLRERRDAVWGIHERIVHARWFWTQPGQPAPASTLRAA